MFPNFFSLCRVGFKAGLLVGFFSLLYELVKYIVEVPFLNTWVSSLLYLLSLIALTLLTIRWIVGAEIFSFWSYFTITFIANILASIIACLSLIIIHHVLDAEYKKRMADSKIELMQENAANFESKNNAKVTSTADFEKLRQTEIENFELNELIKMPIKGLPFTIIFSVILSIILKRNQSESSRQSYI